MKKFLVLPLLALAPLFSASAVRGSDVSAESTDAPLVSPLSLSRPSYLDAAPPKAYAFSDDVWHISLGIPIWIPGLNGDLIVKGREISPDQNPGDTVDLLKERLNFGFAFHAEARKNRLTFIGDLLYVDLRAEGSGGRTEGEAFLRALVYELSAAYTIVEPQKRGFGAFRLDALAGVRVSSVHVGLDGANDSFDTSTNHTIYDPIVGLRCELGLTEWLSLKGRADYGGFGISAWDAADYELNVDAGFAFYIAEWFEVDLGYRYLKYHFVRDPGVAEVNAAIQGPYVSLIFSF